VHGAFSLTELVIVLVILAVITAIAIPRFSVAAENARASALLADAYTLQSAVQHYAAEHTGRTPAHNVDGSLADGALFARRLLERTDETGTPSPTGLFGPYLRTMPMNAVNGRDSFRVGGAAGGEDSDGWQFDPATLEVVADDSPESAAATRGHKKTKEFIEKAKKRRH
jgi:prepilin-type N-terminal cleavage/methylation domain-containing protein